MVVFVESTTHAHIATVVQLARYQREQAIEAASMLLQPLLLVLDRRQSSFASFDIPPARPPCCWRVRTARIAGAGEQLWLSQKCCSQAVRQRIEFQHPTAENGKLDELCLAKISDERLKVSLRAAVVYSAEDLDAPPKACLTSRQLLFLRDTYYLVPGPRASTPYLVWDVRTTIHAASPHHSIVAG
jgi:hypothetical protein